MATSPETPSPLEGSCSQVSALGRDIGVSTTLRDAHDASRTDEGPIEPPRAAPGRVIDRYIVLSFLGAGAMGAVYVAHDPELERKIALKLLRSESTWSDGLRLLREARALAKLAHPNVVAVYDVGTVTADGTTEVFIGMEFVEGVTATKWLADGRRSSREILEVFMAAARGLAAAHKAGLVHRDFKPDNVMVGGDGRVRVMDFGLARAVHVPPSALRLDQTLTSDSQSVSEPRLTHEGTLVGTPVYMAAEVWQGVEVDERSDQFAFCASLWEALYGQRPFRGKTMAALMSAVTNGRIDPPPRGKAVPAWLHRILLRGLASDPARRFVTMDALIAEIERGQARRRRWRAALGLGLVGAVGAGFAGVRMQRESACEAAGAQIEAIWNEATQAQLQATLAATGASYAGTTYDKVRPLIDAWTAEWSALRVQACREATIEGTRAPALYDLTGACLDEQRDALAGLLEVLRDSTATDVQRIVPAVAGLTRLTACTERSSLERRPRPPEDLAARQAALALRRDVMRVQGLLSAGRYAEGLERAEALLTAAERLAYRPLVLQASTILGHLAARLDAHERAEEALRQVYVEAGGMGADALAAEAAVELVGVVGVGRDRPAEGLQWATSAQMLLERLGDGQELLRATLFNNLALIHGSRSEYDEALAFAARALAIREAALGPAHPDVAAALNNLAKLQRMTGAYDEALATHERALKIREESLGPDHPEVATTLNNLALLHQFRGSYGPAQQLFERALAIRRAAFGGHHVDVATTLNNLGALLYLRGDFARSQALLDQALAIRREQLGADHHDVSTTLYHLGLLRLTRGDDDEARQFLERALAIREKQRDDGHLRVAQVLEGLGALQFALGAYEEAQALHERVLATRRGKLGAQHADVARAQHNLAMVRQARGDAAEAEALARRALAGFEQALGPEHPEVAEILNTLAQLVRADDVAEAEHLIARALAVSLRTRGADHPVVATSLQCLGEIDRARGDLDAAEQRFARALAIREASLGPDVREVAEVLLALGELALRRGRAAQARPLLERAVKIRERGVGPAHLLAEARLALARALIDGGREGDAAERGRQLAMRAAEGFRAAGKAHDGPRAAAESLARP